MGTTILGYSTLAVIVWVLAVFGASNGIAVAHLIEPIRKKIVNWPIIGGLIHCPMCLGFWFGGAASLLTFSPTDNIIMDCFFGSITSWILFLLIQKRQFESG
tara:strand:+ start:869 stop:1174 length:306 start_codon:yes stop_codon:yes gene_type:complete